MKNNLKSVLIMLTAAMMFPACSSDEDLSEIETPEQQMLTLVADMPDVANTGTRTEIGYDKDGNIVPMWSKIGLYEDILSPSKVVNDYILAKFEGQASIHMFSAQIDGPSRTARFTEVRDQGSFHSTCTLEEDLMNVADDTDVYFFKSAKYLFNAKNNPAATFSGRMEGTCLKEGSFPSDDDILISKPIKASEIKSHKSKDVTLNFKRVNAIIRINLIPDNDVNLSNKYLAQMQLSTFSSNDKKNFGCDFTFDKDGNINKIIKGGILFYKIINENEKILAPIIKFGENGYPAYICCMPMELEAGRIIDLTITDTSNLVLHKTLTVPEGGIKLNAGELTTFNFSIQKEDLIRNPNIYIDKAGALTKEMLEGAIKTAIEENNSYLDISGNINAQDIDLIRQALTNEVEGESADGIFLHLENANLVCDGTTYTDSEGNKLEMKENTIGKDMFYGMKGIKFLGLPDCVTKIKTNAINNNENLTQLQIGNNVTTIEKNAIAFTDKEKNKYLKISTLPDVLKSIDLDFFNGETSEVILVLDSKWEEEEGNRHADFDNMRWCDHTWKRIYE